MVHQPLLDLLSSLLTAVLAGDLRATAAARELEQARREADLDGSDERAARRWLREGHAALTPIFGVAA